MADRFYSVTGTVKKGHMREYEIIVMEKNASDAKRVALGEWEAEGRDEHLFWLAAKRTIKAPTIHNMRWHKIGENVNGHWVEYV